MDLARIHKKLDEASFFLGKLNEEGERLSGEGETAFDYYLSAFNSAARTVDYRLCHEQGAVYRKWYQAWRRERLTPVEDSLITFMASDRAEEIHRSGSRRRPGQEGVAFPIGEHRRGGALHYVAGPPDMPPVVACKTNYLYTIDSIPQEMTKKFAAKFAAYKAVLPQRVVDACTTYLTLLHRMVADFVAECGSANFP